MNKDFKNLAEVEYQKAFSHYNKVEKEFFNAYNLNTGDLVEKQNEMRKAWQKVNEIIEKMITINKKCKNYGIRKNLEKNIKSK